MVVIGCVLLLLTWAIAVYGASPSLIALWPAGVALITILVFRQAVLGLLAGSLAGCLLIGGGHLGNAIIGLVQDHFFASMQGSWRIGAILFTLILGSFTVVIEKGGGFESLAKRLLGKTQGNPQRRLETATGLLGLLCFFDGLANSLLLGRITRPLADRVGVTRAKMAYLVDSTSSSVACIAFISTWIATQLSLIQQSIEGRGISDSAYTLFFKSIPQNFYCLFTLILVVLVIWRRWDFGPMKKAKAIPPGEMAETAPSSTSSIWIALAPIIILSISIISLFYLWETRPVFPVTTDKLTAAFSGNAGPYALTVGSIIGLLAACFLFPKKRQRELSPAVSAGAASMLGPLLILVTAWTFGSVLKELGTAKWLADTMSGSFSPDYFPAAIFATGAAISFLTGSSWGTMALLMPLALPAYLDLAPDQPVLLSAVIGAVFSGAVFGDHCSPFSDTTIVSAFACGVTAQDHVITQLPYALLSATVALVIGYVGLGAGLPVWSLLIIGTLLLGGLACAATRQKPKDNAH
ncbi:sodium/hydrogen exchanger [Oceaniferula spumae]|uniref:Sodium/hydrogen exchanger n=1 Tax=Oceaniferula spumae TaxID=2979115 RepID=A0AAT9FNV6_9BACT